MRKALEEEDPSAVTLITQTLWDHAVERAILDNLVSMLFVAPDAFVDFQALEEQLAARGVRCHVVPEGNSSYDKVRQTRLYAFLKPVEELHTDTL